jgi:hypothetical protein
MWVDVRQVPFARAAPRPVVGLSSEAGSHWVSMNVVDGGEEMLFVANETVPIITHPDLSRDEAVSFGAESLGARSLGARSPEAPPLGTPSPSSAPFLFQEGRDSSARVAFPRLHDPRQVDSVIDSNQDVNVIWHDDPGDQVVALTVKVTPGIDNARRYPGMSKYAGTHTSIEPRIDATSHLTIPALPRKILHLYVES